MLIDKVLVHSSLFKLYIIFIRYTNLSSEKKLLLQLLHTFNRSEHVDTEVNLLRGGEIDSFHIPDIPGDSIEYIFAVTVCTCRV